MPGLPLRLPGAIVMIFVIVHRHAYLSFKYRFRKAIVNTAPTRSISGTNSSPPSPRIRGGGPGGSYNGRVFTVNPTLTLPLARGGLGWGSSWEIATPRTHERRSRLYGAGCQPLSLVKRGKRKLSRRESRLDPTLTLPLPRGGDRK